MSASTATTGIGPKPRIWLGALIASTVPAVLIWTLTDPLGGHRLVTETAGGAQPVTIVSVLVASVLACVAGLGLAGLLARFTRRARTIWLVVSPLVLVLSMVGTLSATSVSSMLILASLHCVVGIPVIAAGRTLASLR